MVRHKSGPQPSLLLLFLSVRCAFAIAIPLLVTTSNSFGLEHTEIYPGWLLGQQGSTHSNWQTVIHERWCLRPVLISRDALIDRPLIFIRRYSVIADQLMVSKGQSEVPIRQLDIFDLLLPFSLFLHSCSRFKSSKFRYVHSGVFATPVSEVLFKLFQFLPLGIHAKPVLCQKPAVLRGHCTTGVQDPLDNFKLVMWFTVFALV